MAMIEPAITPITVFNNFAPSNKRLGIASRTASTAIDERVSYQSENEHDKPMHRDKHTRHHGPLRPAAPLPGKEHRYDTKYDRRSKNSGKEYQSVPQTNRACPNLLATVWNTKLRETPTDFGISSGPPP
ncbi:hypothetical protein [Burkholderia ubonensis]|uniref:hypothetical protein n=1 Tax=Burkholderia ubonensis TaxID=101571 RepID=UPI0012F7FB7D|nr:hypothetical protein [Burkholderia ubonensis]